MTQNDGKFSPESLRASAAVGSFERVQLDSKPLVSVVICCYNQSEFLSDAIESVLVQSTSPVELIVIDDGSTDDCEAVATRFRNVKYLHQKHGGHSKARNAGLQVSSGSFIAYLDADDRLLPHAIKSGLERLNDHANCAFAAGRFRHIDERGRPLPPWLAARRIGHTYSDLLRFNVIEMQGAVLYRRKMLEAVGGFDEGLAASEDYDVYLRLARHYAFIQYGDVIAEYRKHRGNTTRDMDRMLRATVSVLEAQRRFVAGNAELKNALDAGLTHYRSSYGRALLRKAINRARYPHEWGLALREIATVLTLAPVGVWSAVCLALAASASKVRPTRG